MVFREFIEDTFQFLIEAVLHIISFIFCWGMNVQMMMVYNTQNYWVSGLCPSSGILNTRKQHFWKMNGDFTKWYRFRYRCSQKILTQTIQDTILFVTFHVICAKLKDKILVSLKFYYLSSP
jgi:hypothetical protein